MLVNLLVAMMSDTYGRMQAAAEREFYFVRYKRIFEFQHILHPLPPPLNLPFTLVETCQHWLNKFNITSVPIKDKPLKPPAYDEKLDGRHLMSTYIEREAKFRSDQMDEGVRSLRRSVGGIERSLEQQVGHL